MQKKVEYKLKIAGFDVPVSRVPPKEIDDDHAEYVSTDDNKPGPAINLSATSLVPEDTATWHEGLHCIFDLTGISKQLDDAKLEETIVHVLELHGLKLAEQIIKRREKKK